MNRDEILNQGRPSEPNCFESDREEQWYKIGLYDGASSNVWHSIADGDLPKEDGDYIVLIFGRAYVYRYNKKCNYWRNMREEVLEDWHEQGDITHWMEIPSLD